MFDPQETIAQLKAHFAQNDTYTLTGEALLAWLQDMETVANLVTAATTGAAEAETQGLPERHGCRDLAVFLRTTLCLDAGEAQRRSRLVHELPSLPKTREALYSGAISGRHALIISDTVKRVLVKDAVEAERALCTHAPTVNPRQLMYAGKRVRALTDPDGVYRDEQEGIAQRSLRMATDQDGFLHVKAMFDPLAGQKIKALLVALARPRPVGGQRDPRTVGQRLADALVETVEITLATEDLPTSGGVRPQVLVTIDHDRLAKSVGVGETAWGDPVSAGLLRQLACDAVVLPAVLGGRSRPLDLGRSRRTATPAQRPALAIRDKGCAFPGV